MNEVTNEKGGHYCSLKFNICEYASMLVVQELEGAWWRSYLNPWESFSLDRASVRSLGCIPCLVSLYPSTGFAATVLGETSGFITDRFFFIFDLSQPSTLIDNGRSSHWAATLLGILSTSLSLSTFPDGLAGVLARTSVYVSQNSHVSPIWKDLHEKKETDYQKKTGILENSWAYLNKNRTYRM